MATVYNRYNSFIGDDGSIQIVPFISIPKRSTDKYTYWELGKSRMDLLSYKYYGDASYGWLILQANPELPSIEYLIDNGEKIRIPYPLESVITQYENDIKIYKEINGED
jgi:hypothetical protein